MTKSLHQYLLHKNVFCVHHFQKVTCHFHHRDIYLEVFLEINAIEICAKQIYFFIKFGLSIVKMYVSFLF